MRRSSLSVTFVLLPFVALVYLAFPVSANAQVGPDLVVGDVFQGQQLGREGELGSGTVGLSFATDACNQGGETLHWFALPSVDHPVIAVNLYRLETVAGSDRLEQIGYSWIKHGFAAGQFDGCGFGCDPFPGSSQLGVGCSDTYIAIQFHPCGGPAHPHPMGPRSVIHPYNGVMPEGAELGPGGGCDINFPSANHFDHTHTDISHRVQVQDVDLLPELNVGKRYFAEGQYIVPHEFVAGNGNQNNNVSYREVGISGPTADQFVFTDLGSTFTEQPAINAWPGAAQTLIEPAPLSDGQGILAYKVTQVAPQLWHYEYAVYNMNLDRAIGALSIPYAPDVVISNVGFFAAPHHAPEANAENYSNVPWAISTAGNTVTWSTDSFAVDPLANAVRWGRLYNFRFDANSAPENVDAVVGLFKTGTTVSAVTSGPGPPGPTDCNENGIADNCDLTCADACAVPGCGLSPDCNGNDFPDECDVSLGFVEDCNGTLTPDVCDVVSGTSEDCTANGIPDECEEDCNNNGFADSCDILAGTSGDCNGNDRPDDCEPGGEEDCNGNEIADLCDIFSGTSPDQNGNGVPDECEPQSGIIYVDDDGPNDPGPGFTNSSDPDEDGSLVHPYDAIQEAIDAAFPDDTIIVRDGLYLGIGNRSISFRGKRITVRSENGPNSCVVDGQFFQPTFVFDSSETRASRLEGLKLVNAPNEPPFPNNTAHIICIDSSPTIDECIIDGGGSSGILLRGSVNLVISRCTISNNSVFGISAVEGAAATIFQCTIIGNGFPGISARDSLGRITIVSSRILDNGFGGLDLRGENDHRIHNCLVAGNLGIGIFLTPGTIATINNCTVVNNGSSGIFGCGAIVRNSIVRGHENPPNGADIQGPTGDNCLASVQYSNVGEPSGPSFGVTNINADPKFIDPDNGDYRLSLALFSPCIDAGSNAEAPTDVTDLDGDGNKTETIPFDLDGRPRILDTPGFPGADIDMGAYEYSDCNENGVRDEEDIAEGTSGDCNSNAWPDECDLSLGDSRDCNDDGVLNECEADCDGNGLPDNCEWRDCNLNDVFDVCDIQGGTSQDVDGSNIPDECECPPPPPLSGPNELVANRYLAINANTPSQSTALRVTITEVPSGFEDFLGKVMWVGPPTERCENSAQFVIPVEGCGPAPGIEEKQFWTSSFVCDPFYTDWGRKGTVYVVGSLVVPGATYVVEANEQSCGPGSATLFSGPLVQRLGDWGDVVKENATCPPPNPDGRVDVVTDVVALLNKFVNNFCALRKARADLQPEEVDFVVDIVDVLFTLGAFTGESYPFGPGPDPCP